MTSSDLIQDFYISLRQSLGQYQQFSNVSKSKPLVDWAEETRKSTLMFGTFSLVSAMWSLFEVATDVLLFMQDHRDHKQRAVWPTFSRLESGAQV